MKMHIFMDSSAARSTLARSGAGRVRHLDAKVLWVQDMVACGRAAAVRCVPGEMNCSDIGTKPLQRDVSERHREALGLARWRAAPAAAVAGVEVESARAKCVYALAEALAGAMAGD